MQNTELEPLRVKVALACRILARHGLVEGILGHVSLRVGPSSALVRCRGPEERGLLFTVADDIRLLNLDGTGDLDGYAPPNELPLHTVTLRARPAVNVVVHAHPPAVVAADLAGAPLVPLVGAFNIPGARLAAVGVPVYPRAVLIRRAELANEMLASMGDHSVCILRGHGLTATGTTLEQAVARAIAVDDLARMTLDVMRAGGVPRSISPEDMAELPDLGSGFNDVFTWRYHVARLAHEGLGI